jgi:poly[(R)-3-hydroxyalkanoate] polymerase subunit PhaC
MSYSSSNAALPLLRQGLLRWSPSLGEEAEALRQNLAKASADGFAAAVEREGRRRLDAFLTGVERYRRHPYRRDVDDPPVVWAEGTTRLYDFGRSGGGGKGGAMPVLLVPSLINRAYILDLSARHSFARWLSAAGFWPFLIDWGAPGPVERGFALTDYVVGRLEPALESVLALTGEKPGLLGYCMGGLLAVALAHRRPDALRALALLATPWDFHAGRPAQAMGLATFGAMSEGLMAALGELPVDAIQMLFASIDPVLAERKFSAFAALDPDSDAARNFVALEDWLNDGVPLAAPVARECLAGWYGANSPAAGTWRVGGAAVAPARLSLPSLVVIPGHDRIVPPESAEALGRALPGATVMRPDVGHIGMMVSRGVERALWPDIAEWLRDPK